MLIDFDAGFVTVDLSHAMVAGMPNYPSAPEYRFIPNLRLGDFELADGYWGCNEFMMMSGHSGTHLDALGHVARDGRLFGGLSVDDAQSGIEGLKRHSIADVPPIIRRGVLIDAATHLGVDVMAPWQPIDVNVIEDVSAATGVDIKSGDCVLVRTGWERYWGDPQQYLGLESGLPGITVDALTWLADRGVYLVGSDTGVVEVTSPGMERLPVHLEALVNRGVFLLENMALEGLAGRAPEFMFFASPLRLRGASGSPLRPVAVFPS